jgi:hypothetical protein
VIVTGLAASVTTVGDGEVPTHPLPGHIVSHPVAPVPDWEVGSGEDLMRA